jgi:multidrug efflux pump subunit AcrA (membrane-fusion protein)
MKSKKYKAATTVIALLAAVIGVLIVISVLGGQAPAVPRQAPVPGGQGGNQGGAPPPGAQGGNQGGGPAPASRGAPARSPASPGGQGGNQAARSATAVRVTPLVLGTIENYVMINGDVLAASQVSVFPAAGGKVIELRYKIGQPVAAGAVIAMIDPSRPGENYSPSPVYSTVGGTILQLPVNPGDTVGTNTVIAVVGRLDDLRVETYVPERYAAAMRSGLEAVVRFTGLEGEDFAARVDELSPVLDPASRTRRITLRFASRDSRILPGMFATVTLVTNSRSRTPVIPRASVINSYGSWFVFTVDENSIAHRREVELGLENETYFEVIKGLEEGERVVSAGQNFLSDNEPVRIVE